MEQQDWAQVVAAATRAPSIHNTQPWRFRASGDRLDVFLRPRAGAAGARPDGPPADHQLRHRDRVRRRRPGGARAWPRRSPAARRRRCRPPGHRAGDRWQCRHRAGHAPWPRRSTVGTPCVPPFLSRAVPAELVDRMPAEAGAFGTWVKPIDRSEEEVATVFLISRAEEMEQGDPAYLAELQRWLRTDPGAVDGVPVEAVPSDDPHARPSNWLIRDFVVGEREQQPDFLAAGDPDAPAARRGAAGRRPHGHRRRRPVRWLAGRPGPGAGAAPAPPSRAWRPRR